MKLERCGRMGWHTGHRHAAPRWLSSADSCRVYILSHTESATLRCIICLTRALAVYKRRDETRLAGGEANNGTCHLYVGRSEYGVVSALERPQNPSRWTRHVAIWVSGHPRRCHCTRRGDSSFQESVVSFS